MKKILVAIAMVTAGLFAQAQTTYDSKTLVDTNNNSTSTSTVTSTNTNVNTSTSTSVSTVDSSSTNVNTSTNTNTNYNVNSGTQTVNNVNSGSMTYNNNNVNSGTMTYNNNNVTTSNGTMTNNNYNVNSGEMTYNNKNVSSSDNKNTNVNQNINSGEMTNRNINDSNITQRLVQPPPTAVAPSMMSGGNSDLCTTGTSGSVQTQIFGVSTGGTIRDENCERLKLSKTLYDMGMKVAAVATMCQDRRVFDAMMQAGTPCPYEGKIGEAARKEWETNLDKIPAPIKEKNDDTYKKIGIGSVLGIAVYKLFGF